MPEIDIDIPIPTPPARGGMTHQERSSLTHGDFWIPEEEREKYKRALSALNRAGVPYVVTGAYAIYEYTGIYRETKDLDVFVEPAQVIPAMTALRDEGFQTRLEQAHWLAKATLGSHFVDIIFGMGNGLALVDADWYDHSRAAILAANQVRVAPAEELIWHRLFINERHRQDMADIVHLIVCMGDKLNWRRLIDKTGEHWPLLLSQLLVFSYVYPEVRGRVPPWVMEELLDLGAKDAARERSGELVSRGTLMSRFSFAIDVNEWGLKDERRERIDEMERDPVIREIAESDVWDERSEWADAYLERVRS
jgi:hypothetical protein